MEGSNVRGGGGESVDLCLTNYKLEKTLGIGTFGRVKLAKHVLTGDKVAIYIISRRWTEDRKMEEIGKHIIAYQQF